MPRRKTSRPATSGLSNDPEDKMLAALHHHEPKTSADYLTAPFYFDACRAWYRGVSWEQRDTGATVINAFTHRGGKI